jgi:hypothetical protein
MMKPWRSLRNVTQDAFPRLLPSESALFLTTCIERKEAIKTLQVGPSQEEMAAAKNIRQRLPKRKDCKKVQKQEEQASLDKNKKEQLLAAKRAATAVQCAACGQGVLGCGFEKFKHTFCSPKLNMHTDYGLPNQYGNK